MDAALIFTVHAGILSLEVILKIYYPTTKAGEAGKRLLDGFPA
jgi:hypothetical protein